MENRTSRQSFKKNTGICLQIVQVPCYGTRFRIKPFLKGLPPEALERKRLL